MGLHAISDDNLTIAHHCNNPDCVYHNCANWEPWQECSHHDELEFVVVPAEEARRRFAGAVDEATLNKMGDIILSQKTTTGRKEGKTRYIPVDHPDIQYTGPGVVSLPICECGTQMFLKVTFTEKELQAPNIRIVQRDPANPSIITGISQHPMVARHQALHAKLQAMGRAHTPPGQ